jgi:hypothetical protein
VIRITFLVSVVLLWPVLSYAACDARDPAQISQILSRGIDLNERFKRSVKSGDDAAYRSARKQHEQYSEKLAMPCVRKASQLLGSEVDEALLEKLIAFAISHENSADETVSEATASVFARQPDAVAASFSKLPPSRSMVLVRSIEAGWPAVRKTLEPATRQDRDLQLKALRTAQAKSATTK